jgi:cysteinyl-tRNA synthetase
MRIHNTLTGKKDNFQPSKGNQVRMYVCGPTVYNLIHIGNGRVYVFFDTVRRFFESLGYEVLYVSNFTDIDDKIIKRSLEEGVSFEELARKYEEEFKQDISELGLKHADITPRATENIDGMIEMISGLIEKGFAYEAGGDVYFSVQSFPSYGKLSKRTLEEMRAGERVEPSPYKRDPLDFALWKAAKPGEPFWDSPFGKGRPGWHIECSVMSVKHLGFGFDIHGGGQDLIFPHHENEIAQAEAYYGDEPFVRFWMHNGLLTVRSEKMAKSLGNIILLRDALRAYGADTLKIFYLSTHYRSPLDYTPERVKELQKALRRILETRNRIKEVLKLAGTSENEASKRLTLEIEDFERAFVESLKDDFNTAKALAELFEYLKKINIALDEAGSSLDANVLGKAVNALEEKLQIFGIDLSRFESFLRKKVEDGMQDLLLQLRGLAAYYNIQGESVEEIVGNLIKLRQQERQQKRFERADEIRNKLVAIGILLEDTPQGTRYRIVGD